jgi:hypothetical protein
MRKQLLPSLLCLTLLLASLILPSGAAAAPPDAPAAAPDLRTTWFFAEGATAPPFDTWLLLFNPNPNAATATVTFFGTGPIATRTVTIGPNARASLFINQILPNAAFGMRVDANLPIAAERAMYFRQDGTAVAGIPEPSTTWLFAEGATAFPHHTWFLLLNPNTAAASVTFTFFFEGGGSQTTTLTVPPQSRASLFANQVLPAAAFSTRITSNVPIVAERSMFRVNTGSGHAMAGATAPARAWTFAEGSTFAPFQTWYLIFNPNPTPIRLSAIFLTETGPGPSIDFTVPANARQSIFVNQINPNIHFGAAFFIADGAEFVAERSMFFGNGAHGTLGTTALASTWFFAEGSTAFPFQEWILLANPSPQEPASATLTFFFPDGTSTSRSVSVPSQGRTSVFVDLLIPQTAVATRVTSSIPIVAERSMYFAGGNGGHNTIGIPQ